MKFGNKSEYKEDDFCHHVKWTENLDDTTITIKVMLSFYYSHGQWNVEVSAVHPFSPVDSKEMEFIRSE